MVLWGGAGGCQCCNRTAVAVLSFKSCGFKIPVTAAQAFVFLFCQPRIVGDFALSSGHILVTLW